MKRIASLLACLAVVFSATSCIRTSTVVKVAEDGTGSIIARYYFSPQMLAMVEQLGAAGGALGEGGAQGPNFGMIGEMAKPDEVSLKADASNYGEGVVYAKHEAGKDEDGWEGYTVEYTFEDVRKIQIDQNSAPGKAKEFVEASGEEIDADKGSKITFSLEGKTLTIHNEIAEDSIGQMFDEKQMQQAKAMGMKPSQAMQMAAGMTQGMRVGFFVRADGQIAETNAEHATGNLIILSDADVPQIMQDPDFADFVDQASENPESVTTDSVKELFSNIEAMTIELQEEVTVEFE